MSTASRLQTPAVVVVAAGFLAGAIAYPRLPGPFLDDAPTARALVAFTLPVAALVVCLLFRSLWTHDRVRSGNGAFESAYRGIVLQALLFMVALHALVMIELTGGVDAMGVRVAGGRIVVVLLGVILVGVGNLLPRTRPNVAVGVRTARTLASARLWQQVHRAGGYATVALGIAVVLIGIVSARDAVGPLVSAAASAAAAVVFATYLKHARA